MSWNPTVSDHSHTRRGILSFLLYVKIRTLSGTLRHVSFLLYHLKTHTLVGTFCLSYYIWRYEPSVAHCGTCLPCCHGIIWRHTHSSGHFVFLAVSEDTCWDIMSLKLYLKPETHRLVAIFCLWYCIISRHTRLWSKEPPPHGGFLFAIFHDQEPPFGQLAATFCLWYCISRHTDLLRYFVCLAVSEETHTCRNILSFSPSLNKAYLSLWLSQNALAHLSYLVSAQFCYCGVATISRLLRIIGLFWKRAL